MERRISKLNISFSLMMILFTLLLLWISESISNAGFLLLFLMIFPSEMLVLEKRYVSVLLNVLLPGAIILFLPFKHYIWFFFITVVGWYAPVRTLFFKFRSPWIGSLLSFIFCNVSVAFFLLSFHFLGIHPLSDFDLFWSIIYLFVSEIGFALLDVFYQLFRKLYTLHFRKFLLV